MGICLRRDAIHRVSPARGDSPAGAFFSRGGPCGGVGARNGAPPMSFFSALGRPGGDGRDESRLYVADSQPRGMACALYVTLLMRTRVLRRLLALERRRGGAFRPIHPMDFCFHPMDRAFHPMDFSIDGHFSVENGLRFAPYSGENGVLGRPCGRASRGNAWKSGGSDFRSFACDRRRARKYSILRVKKQPSDGV